MSLADFTVHRDQVAFQGGTLSVRGLSLNDITFLVRDHLDELNTLFAMYEKEETRETAAAQSVQFAIRIIKETPRLVAQLIVLASDSPQDQLAKAETLPLPVQVEMMRKIIEMTFEEAGGAKKFLDSLVTMVTALRPKTATED